MSTLFQKLKGLFQKNESIDIDLESLQRLVSSLSWKYIKDFMLNDICTDTERFTIVMAGDDYPESLAWLKPSNNPRIDLLSKVNADFFQTFNFFGMWNSEFHIDISYVGISEFEPSYVRMAYDMAHEIVSKPNEDIVFFLDWDLNTGNIDEPWLDYTIWHYAFEVILILHPEFLNKVQESQKMLNSSCKCNT